VARLHENEENKFKEENDDEDDEQQETNNKPAFMNVFQQRRQRNNEVFLKTRVKRTYGWLQNEDVNTQGKTLLFFIGLYCGAVVQWYS